MSLFALIKKLIAKNRVIIFCAYSSFFKKSNFNSKNYWEKRYVKGNNSGSGSYGRLALFKADIINCFVKKNKIKTSIEFGCGDGNQLNIFSIPKYAGFDVSKKSIVSCKRIFKNDKTKSFFIYSNTDKNDLQKQISRCL